MVPEGKDTPNGRAQHGARFLLASGQEAGAHTLLFRYTTIAMDNPNNNQIIFEYDYRVVALEPGGVPMPEMCDCAGNASSTPTAASRDATAARNASSATSTGCRKAA